MHTRKCIHKRKASIFLFNYHYFLFPKVITINHFSDIFQEKEYTCIYGDLFLKSALIYPCDTNCYAFCLIHIISWTSFLVNTYI